MIALTTLLARQHFKTFAERFRGTAITVRPSVALVTAKDAALTRQGLAEGTVDIVIGTHAVLAKSVSSATSAFLSLTRNNISASATRNG